MRQDGLRRGDGWLRHLFIIGPGHARLRNVLPAAATVLLTG